MKVVMFPLTAGSLMIGGTATAQQDTARRAGQQVMGQQQGDRKVASAAIAANETEVAAADLALGRTQNEQVREYARRLRRDHSGMIEKLRQHAGLQAGQGEAELREMKRESDDQICALMQLDTAAFDSVYVELMIEKHQKMLTTIDSRWLPNVQDAALRSTLEDAKPTVREHLREAEALRNRKRGMPEPTTRRDTSARTPPG